MRFADLYAPQGFDLEEGGSLSQLYDTVWWLAWAAQNIMKRTWKFSVHEFYAAPYKINKFTFYILVAFVLENQNRNTNGSTFWLRARSR